MVADQCERGRLRPLAMTHWYDFMKKVYIVVISNKDNWSTKLDTIWFDKGLAWQRVHRIRKRVNNDKYLADVQSEYVYRSRHYDERIELPA